MAAKKKAATKREAAPKKRTAASDRETARQPLPTRGGVSGARARTFAARERSRERRGEDA